MHPEALRFASRVLRDVELRRGRVLEIGSRDLNGSVRCLFANAASYTGIDLRAGAGVDIQADGATFVPVEEPDLVVCMETLEHTDQASAIVRNAAAILRKPGGRLLVTCATHPRVPHSGIDGGPLKAGEFYRNVPPDELVACAEEAGLQVLTREVHFDRGDLYLVARA
jgi:SAM-dependent methyltransferase